MITTSVSNDLLGLDPAATFEEQGRARLARLQAQREQPPVLGKAALAGLAGEVIRAKSPDTEATDAAMLITLLTAFSAMSGRGSWVMVGDQKHHPVVFSVVVGGTSRDRKGTSLAAVKPVLEAADDPDAPFLTTRVARGIGSGEALIQEVAGAAKAADGGPRGKSLSETNDQRLLVIETEYGRLLTVGARQGSTLSMTVRSAWDGDPLANTTKGQRLLADSAHICILGHVTQDELRRKMAAGDDANGYANRFLHVLSRRETLLPEPRQLSETETKRLADKLRSAITFASSAREVTRSQEFRTDWDRVYRVIESQPDGGPMFGNMTARASAHILRLSLVYALLDQSHELQPRHLRAALAVWEYAEATVAYLWGPSLGSARLDKLADLLTAEPEGLTITAIHRRFSNNMQKHEVDDLVQLLVKMGMAKTQRRQSPKGGRPSTVVLSTVG
ncbi:YfjI family protein [Aeromicrobium sp. 50.2.37]|uniref:YfjI family protein n=1 Tax=Aeromicrobium sp. 50.2.37 TaxID=2969305 RepID=UPI002150003B|nr:YfjI family protein [Aeromicrobium sp. 50.2.37]MCR4514662.1 YfjI family protein [Aeromicrobium sp. 50.2.37]